MYAIVTMNGLNAAYMNINNGKYIFDDIILPVGIERALLIERIMIRCGEFSVMHTNINYMHHQIQNFFSVHYRTFERWIKALDIDYDPLENYNRYEEYVGAGSNEGSNASQGTDSGTDTLTKAAFNATDYAPYERTQTSGSSSMNGTNEGTYEDEHNIHTHGNIGVTTSQQMLQSELDVSRFNIYLEIAELFAEEFCIMVY